MRGKRETKKGILVVSFGTSHLEACRETIDRIETDIQAAFPEHQVYRAWTSGVIRRKLLCRDGVRIPDVKEALDEMHREGIRSVVVQPTYVINGFENDGMRAAAKERASLFAQLRIGSPLLTTDNDCRRVIQAAAKLQPPAREALILMGHGTEHPANAVYAALDGQFKEMGYRNIYVEEFRK